MPLKSIPKPVFIIAEAGSNWKAGSASADMRRAKALIDVALRAGADAVKFQTFSADRIYVKNAGPSGYLAKHGIRTSIHELFKKLAMPHSMIPALAGYCKKRGIEFMSSAFSLEDFYVVNAWVKTHKIASYEITHPGLLRAAARCGKPLILSTGAASLEDIDWAVSYYRRQGGKHLTLMQCTAKYPAPFLALNLRAIHTLIRRFWGVSCGFSDHSLDPVIGPVAAVALGAKVIEKHFTLSNRLAGPDHRFALTPAKLSRMVRAIRDCEAALGTGQKVVLPEEKELRDYAQRAVQATRDIKKGEILIPERNIAVLRPGNQPKGEHPKFLIAMAGKRARCFISAGTGIRKNQYAG